MPFPKVAAKIENLQRAWQWIRSNPDRAYKSHFRELYSAYATSDGALLKQLKSRLDRSIFEPSDACKLFLPKPSGILRPYTLLGIEDQIVYQAMTNVVAERLHPRVRAKYNRQVFGHQYAGASSLWFYRKWTDGYKAFNRAAETVFANGYVWTASFDLTAFYDSIDHNVLRHMLKGIGLDHDFCIELTRLLNKWTATATQIYHDHGIPQGPLSSGLISEAVLKHFDDNFHTRFDVRYFRYVDDIRLFAKSEDHLRHALVSLDRLSKDVGLFPQSGKIDIHRVTNIQDELKSVSSPIETALNGRIPDQSGIRRRLAELAPRENAYRVTDPTRFKFLLAKADPSFRVLDRIWRVFEHAPHYYSQVSAYLQKFPALPDSHGDRLLGHIEGQDLYPPIRASLVTAADDRLSATRTKRFRASLKRLWALRANTPELTAALWNALHHMSHLTERQADYALLYSRTPWLRMRLHFGIPWFTVAASRRDRLLNASMRSDAADVALVAAWLAALLDCEIRKPIRDIHPLAKIVLRENGKLKRADSTVCGVQQALFEMTGVDNAINWRKFFGKSYHHAESKIVACKGYYKTNPTAWVSMLDVFNDLMIDDLFRKDGTIGARNLGNFGGVIENKAFMAKFPRTHAYVSAVHTKRGEGELSHPVIKATRVPTRRIPFKWLVTGRRLMTAALTEIKAKGY
jgi:Reverse transcriptase (RNA-dependent DNA polymerase)